MLLFFFWVRARYHSQFHERVDSVGLKAINCWLNSGGIVGHQNRCQLSLLEFLVISQMYIPINIIDLSGENDQKVHF